MKIKLVVGLGNPGKEYANTRHNMGFMVLDEIAEDFDIKSWKKRNGALYFDTYVGMSRVIFVKPQKFINLSGDVMIDFVHFFDIKTEDIIVVSDDLDLPIGSIKLKMKGSSGGHNGLKNIELNLKTQEYKRIKIGISNNKDIDTKDYVLGKIPKEDKILLKEAIKMAKEATLLSLQLPFEEVMSKYNTKIRN